jgi:Tol biopolymer transport system component
MSGTRIVKSFNGEGVSWSPDGKSLAFLRVNPAGMAVAILSMETGEERAYPHDALGYAQLRWMPDGSGVVAVVRKDDTGGTALYFVDVRTGIFRRLFPKDSSEHVRGAVVEVAPDGKTIYMSFRSAEGSPWRGIVAVDLQTLTEKVIVTFVEPGYPGDNAPALAVSPDGATLVVQVRASPRLARLLAVRTDGSGYRELYGPFPATVIPSVVKWSRDGRSIFFFTHTRGGDWRLLRIPAEGGEPEADGFDTKSAAASVSGRAIDGSPLSFDLSPDGTQIAFGAWRKWVPELRSIGNLLSHLNSRH